VSDNKTEQPSLRKQRQARDQGDIPISAALVSCGALVAALLLLPSCGVVFAKLSLDLVRRAVTGNGGTTHELLSAGLIASLPLLGGAAAAALGVGLLQTGAALVPSRLAPKLSNLDLIEGLKRLFGAERWLLVARASLACAVILWLASRAIRDAAGSLAATIGQPQAAIGLTTHIVRQLLWQAALLTIALAILDVFVTRLQWLKRNRMSKDEVKREHRESEGDPHQKQERRRAHQDLLSQATLLSLKDADVLIVNPTHIAVGLRYNEELDDAPRIVAYGEEHLAKQMIDAARAYGIPVVRDIPIARALSELAVGEEVPAELYEAVAEILHALWNERETVND
jgi:flagellar biosynthesis protein FlhB